ncbi:hypothetical protein ACVIGB_003788 [Bradyrhizobium sp. USDA 4341]
MMAAAVSAASTLRLGSGRGATLSGGLPVLAGAELGMDDGGDAVTVAIGGAATTGGAVKARGFAMAADRCATGIVGALVGAP